MRYVNLSFDDVDWDKDVYFVNLQDRMTGDVRIIDHNFVINFNRTIPEHAKDSIRSTIGITPSMRFKFIIPETYLQENFTEPFNNSGLSLPNNLFQINSEVAILTNNESIDSLVVNIIQVEDYYIIDIKQQSSKEEHKLSLVVDTGLRTSTLIHQIHTLNKLLRIKNDMDYEEVNSYIDFLKLDYSELTIVDYDYPTSIILYVDGQIMNDGLLRKIKFHNGLMTNEFVKGVPMTAIVIRLGGYEGTRHDYHTIKNLLNLNNYGRILTSIKV